MRANRSRSHLEERDGKKEKGWEEEERRGEGEGAGTEIEVGRGKRRDVKMQEMNGRKRC